MKKRIIVQPEISYDEKGIIYISKCIQKDKFILALYGWKSK